MIALWMGWAALCAAWLALAAWGAERVLLRGRGALRFGWAGAMLLSLGVPVAASLRPARAAAAPAVGAAVPERAGAGAAGSLGISPGRAAPAPRDWRAALARADRPLAAAWALASAALLARLVAGALLLARRRRGWAPRDVLGVPVLVSERSGPAVVGVRRAAIVLPAWALPMDEARLALVLRHEQEHLRARDGLLLWGARLAAAAMPWSPALWWMLARLRGAVEIDCDARVLRAAGARVDARSYAALLLDVVRPEGERAVAGVPAFAERAAGLERRIRVMAARRGRAARGTAVGAVAIGAAAVVLACEAPRPRGLTEGEGRGAEGLPDVAVADVAAPAEGTPRCEAIPWKGKLAHVALLVADDTMPGRVRLVARRATGASGGGSTGGALRVSYARAGSASVSCAAPADHGIVRLYGRDAFAAGAGGALPVVALDVDRVTDVAVVAGERARVVAQLTIDPDTLSATSTAAELPWPDETIAPRRAARRTRAVPSVAGTARPGSIPTYAVRADTAASDPTLLARNLYDGLLRGIALPPDREARARAIVRQAASDALRLMHEPSGSPWEAFRRASAMLDTRDAALRALLATDAERRRFDANAAALRP